MPKMKTNKSTAKRFKVTGSGKVLRRQKNMRHILTKMSRKRQRRLRQSTLVDGSNIGALKRLMPYSF